MHRKLPKVGKRSSGNQREHQVSPTYVRLEQEMWMSLRMARDIREGRVRMLHGAAGSQEAEDEGDG